MNSFGVSSESVVFTKEVLCPFQRQTPLVFLNGFVRVHLAFLSSPAVGYLEVSYSGLETSPWKSETWEVSGKLVVV